MIEKSISVRLFCFIGNFFINGDISGILDKNGI